MGCVQLATVRKQPQKGSKEPILRIQKNFDYQDDPIPKFVDYSTAFKNNMFQELVHIRAQKSLIKNKSIQSMKSQNKCKSVNGSPNIKEQKIPLKLFKFYDKSLSHDTILGQETFN